MPLVRASGLSKMNDLGCVSVAPIWEIFVRGGGGGGGENTFMAEVPNSYMSMMDTMQVCFICCTYSANKHACPSRTYVHACVHVFCVGV